MKAKRNTQIVLAAVAVLLIAAIFTVLFFFVRNTDDNDTTIGFIMTGEKDETGWNGLHYKGIKKICEQYDVNLIVAENVDENTKECEDAVRELVNKGSGMIILSSYGYAESLDNVFEEYKDVVFYAIAANTDAENCISYFGRMYQSRYLAGIVAGMTTETGKIGYVASSPNNEVNRGINAFALGVKSCNPDAEVIVNCTGSWDDEALEKAAVENLVSECGIDVVAHHQNREYVIEAAEKAGIYSIGNNSLSGTYSEKYLATVLWNWEELYDKIVREYIFNNSDKNISHWFGLDTNVVDISFNSPLISEETRSVVEEAKAAIISGKDVFSGIVYDNNGEKRCDENEMISDKTLKNNMDWLVEGVRIYD